MNTLRKFSGMVLLTGIVVGVLGGLLVKLGNPPNMGICVACFLRDTAGALGLHRASVVQYIRPEIIGFVLGAFLVSLLKGEFRSQGGSSTVIRFSLGAFLMIGALMFLGCPIRMLLRLGGGDLNALPGLAGFISGIWIGVLFLKRGFVLSRATSLSKANGLIMPTFMFGLLILLLVRPGFIFFSSKGSASQHAPILISFIAGLIIGGLAQRARFCFVAGVRDIILIKNPHLLIGFVAVLLFATITNLTLGQFHLGFLNQPVAHNDYIWNYLGMLLVGLAATLLGGCPLRQLILAGEGNSDSAITVLGMLIGSAFCHNFFLASGVEGVTLNGKIAVTLGILFCFITGLGNREV